MPRPKKVKDESESFSMEDLSKIETETPAEIRKKKLRFNSAVQNKEFDLFADLEARAKTSDTFKSKTEIDNSYIPVPWLTLSYIIGRPGIPKGNIIEIMGLETVGKTSFVCALLGCFMSNNIPCLYLNSEPKAVLSDWRKRLFNTNPEMSEKIDNIYVNHVYNIVHTYDDADIMLREWIKERRETVPKDIPLVVAIDSYTKLLNPEEAEVSFWDEKGKKGDKDTAMKGVADVSKKPGVTAKWLHQWLRSIAVLLEQQNVTLIMVAGKAMDQNANQFLSKEAQDRYNKTRPGGTAMNQSASLQLNLGYKGAIKNGTTIVGKMIEIYVQKNSYGPEKRSIVYNLYDGRAENFAGKDIPGKYIAPAIDMDEALCSLLVEHGLFGLTVSMRKYSSEELNLFRVRPDAIVRAINEDPERVLKVANKLSIYGYETEEDA